MIKSGWMAGVAALLGMLLVPAATAHGAPPVREVDTRVLLDDDGLVAYGGCAEGTCQPAFPAEGLDVLALDLRESYLADGSPALVFRIIVQSEQPAPGASLVLHLQGGDATAGKDLQLDTADGLSYSTSAFDRLDGPFDVGDGHPKALDGWLAYKTLGVKAGDTLSGITVESKRGGTADDIMPGGWYAQGVEVPSLPDEPDPAAATATRDPGAYTLMGPAALVRLTLDASAVDLAHGPAIVQLTLANAVALPQFVNLTLQAPPGVQAALASAGIALDASGTRTVALTVRNATADSAVGVLAVSDLGSRALANVTVHAARIDLGNSTSGRSSTAATGQAPSSKDSSLPVLAMPALAAAALAARRRRT